MDSGLFTILMIVVVIIAYFTLNHYEGKKKKRNDKKHDIIILKFKIINKIPITIMCLILFSFGIYLMIKSISYFPDHLFLSFMQLMISSYLLLYFIILINHYYHESTQQIAYNKKKKELTVKRNEQSCSIGLQSQMYDITLYESFWSQGKRFYLAGTSLGKIEFKSGINKITISELLLNDYPWLEWEIRSIKGAKMKYKQINFL